MIQTRKKICLFFWHFSSVLDMPRKFKFVGECCSEKCFHDYSNGNEMKPISFVLQDNPYTKDELIYENWPPKSTACPQCQLPHPGPPNKIIPNSVLEVKLEKGGIYFCLTFRIGTSVKELEEPEPEEEEEKEEEVS